MRYLATILMLLLVSIAASSQVNYKKFGVDVINGDEPKGINVGEKAPLFKGKDQNGNSVVLSDLLKKGDVVIVFYRGKWCPVCNRYLSNLQDSLTYIKQRGATVVAVTPEIPESALKTTKRTDAEFVIVSDKDESIMRSYDVLFNVTKGYASKVGTFTFTNIRKNNGQDGARLPVPATYIIGSDGLIKYKHFEIDYRSRASVNEMIKILDR
jgi:peroxiredoxin